MTAKEMAQLSHRAMREKYGGSNGYREHMRTIAKKPRKKRSSKTYAQTAGKNLSTPRRAAVRKPRGNVSVGENGRIDAK